MKNIVFIAPPAAGKGTQAKMVREKYNIPHISTGQLLRDEVIKQSEIGKKIENDMLFGNLIADEIIFSLLIERLMHEDCKNGYILDGFPRNINQAKKYDEILKIQNKEITYVFYLKLDREISLKRTIGRLTCNQCSDIYNENFIETKPKLEGVCDKCGGLLIKRNDDNENVFDNRYQTYLTDTAPIIKYYDDLNKLYIIDSSISKEHTFTQITNILDGDNFL